MTPQLDRTINGDNSVPAIVSETIAPMAINQVEVLEVSTLESINPNTPMTIDTISPATSTSMPIDDETEIIAISTSDDTSDDDIVFKGYVASNATAVLARLESAISSSKNSLDNLSDDDNMIIDQ